MTPALQVDDLSFRYRRTDAVTGVSLRVEVGDCYGFLGHNGAGKTTVMRLALGLLPASGGTVRLFGRDPAVDGAAARRGVGALIERPGFHLHRSATRNLEWLALLQGMPRSRARAEAECALELVGLAKESRRRVGTFSLGMRQRLGIAQTLLGQPRLVLLDEPGNGLDPEGIADLRALMQNLTRNGTTVLLSSHQLHELEGLCNRIGVMQRGRMVLEGHVDELRQNLRRRYRIDAAPRERTLAVLEQHGLRAEAHGDLLAVDLGDVDPGEVARTLTAATAVRAFAPEPITLESIYLQAGRQAVPAGAPTATQDPAAVPAAAPATAPATTDGAASPRADDRPGPHPQWLALTHELRVLYHRNTFYALFALPVVFVFVRLFSYRQQVAAGLDKVHAGAQFSADAGSGHQALAQMLQSALPVLLLAALLIGSQTVASEVSRDTLRNTLVRPVERMHVLLAKMLAMMVWTAAAYLWVVLVAAAGAGLLFGYGDLLEIDKNGREQVLAERSDVARALWLALSGPILPLLASAAVAVAASTLLPRPARAMGLTLGLVLLPEILRGPLWDMQGYLLTSHLPLLVRDDSSIAWFEGLARGAADASWTFSGQTIVAPLLWVAPAFAAAWWALRRMRVA